MRLRCPLIRQAAKLLTNLVLVLHILDLVELLFSLKLLLHTQLVLLDLTLNFIRGVGC